MVAYLGGEDLTGARAVPEESLPGPAGRVGPIPSMDGVCPEFVTSLLHRADSFPAVHSQKEQADHHCIEAPVFHPGDRVWLPTRNLPLSTLLVGPFKVLQRVTEVTYRLQIPSDYRISPFYFSLLRPVFPSPQAPTPSYSAHFLSVVSIQFRQLIFQQETE